MSPSSGTPPYPAASLVALPGMRLIDLRGLPLADLSQGRLDVAREQVMLEAPMAVQVWVIDAETAAAWLALGTVGLIVIGGHLHDPRVRGGRDLLHVAGSRLQPGEEATLGAVGIEVARELVNLGDPARPLESLLDKRPRWAAAATDRPVPDASILSGSPFEDLVVLIEGFAFVDLRRASPEALRDGGALERLEPVMARLRSHTTIDLVVWVLAPWVLDALPPDAPQWLGAQIQSLKPHHGHRLALVAPAGQPVGAHPVTTALAHAGATPLRESYTFSIDGASYSVAPIDALHDVYFSRAWTQPRSMLR